MATKGGTIDDLWIQQLALHRPILTGRYYHIAKRVMDLSLAILSMPIWLPTMVVIAIGLRIASPGPVLFVQLRTGKGGKRFKMYKFRSMVKGADKMAGLFARVGKDGNLTGPLKMEKDPRTTPIGRILRKSSLDELPQIINILKGEMSFVGPRPTSWSPESYKLWHTERLDVLPGMTGLWQIADRGDTNFDEWLRWDIRYIERRSLSFDIWILFKTLTKSLKQPGAR